MKVSKIVQSFKKFGQRVQGIYIPGYVVLDFETTGLYPGLDQVTEIAAMRLGADFNVIKSYSCYVSLEKGITLTDFIKDLTGTDEQFLSDYGIFQEEAMMGLWKFINEQSYPNEPAPVMVCHHAAFDLGFCAEWGIAPKNYICTRTMARMLEPKKSASLAAVCKRYGVYNEAGHHTATEDVIMTSHILRLMLPQAQKRRLPYMNTVIQSKDRPLTFIPAWSRVVKQYYKWFL